jgi:hypothetical protein
MSKQTNKLTKHHQILLLIAAINLAIVLLFPPFDDVAVSKFDMAIFAGFIWVFSASEQYQINSALLYLEVTVILINLFIFWLMINERMRSKSEKKLSFRAIAMILIAVNLVGVLLFPPFEYVSHMTKAVLPTFEGFYFIFNPPQYRVIVTPILYLEVMLVLINGAMMLLVFKEKKDEDASVEQAMHYMAKLKAEAAKSRAKNK